MQADDRRLRRLGRGGEGQSPIEERAGLFLAQASDTLGLRDVEIAAIERRLLRCERTRRRPWLWPVTAALAVLLLAGSVSALVGGWRPRLPFLKAAPAAAPGLPKASHPATPRRAGRASAAPSDNLAAVPSAIHDGPDERPPAPSPAPSPHSVVARRVAHLEPPPAPVPAAPAEAPPVEGALSVEARSLADALARWRRDGDAQAALALLAAHDRRFPHGALGVESKVARAEILLALERRGQALAVLDALVLQGLPRARELATLRGELRAQAGRCREARADLRGVLKDRAGDDLGRRASLALATCPERHP